MSAPVSSDSKHRSLALPSVHHLSKFWFKPSATREEVTALLIDQEPGSFLVRNSSSLPGAYGIAIKVETVPDGIVARSALDFVRHFLIEAVDAGVRLKGGNNEPSFGSLSAFIHQHTLTPMALPCKLKLSSTDLGSVFDQKYSPVRELTTLENISLKVLYLSACDVESLTGAEAVARSLEITESDPDKTTVPVNIRVTEFGVVLTDLSRTHFFRQNFLFNDIKYCGFNPYDRRLTAAIKKEDNKSCGVSKSNEASPRIFGLVVQPLKTVPQNVCHTFAETAVRPETVELIGRINNKANSFRPEKPVNMKTHAFSYSQS